jgi:hypothetical protein
MVVRWPCVVAVPAREGLDGVRGGVKPELELEYMLCGPETIPDRGCAFSMELLPMLKEPLLKRLKAEKAEELDPALCSDSATTDGARADAR